VDGDGGERDIDDAGRPAGSGVPQCGADVEVSWSMSGDSGK
jgi:hypothetical protein